MFKFVTKPVPTKFVVLGGVEVNAQSVFNVLESFVDDDDIHGYDLDICMADILVKEGVLEKYTGSKMATLYRKTDKFESFYNQYEDEFFK
jgi:hypothetical protein